MGERLRIRLPHGETDRDKTYTLADPDALHDALWRVNHAWARDQAPDRGDLARVLMAAGDYEHLTTYALGQECCVQQLRDLWRARRAREAER
jgi:hypothetical protein